MGLIHELSDLVANQIIAGEVINRPASVVKELVENSLDANSDEITVKLTDSGINKIEVIDNGDGIEKDDVKLAFMRHTTSKINKSSDLFNLSSLGFRGEALASIAAVSKVIVKTAVPNENGNELHVENGEFTIFKPCISRVGTSIIVSDLFYNIADKLRFIKKPQTELSYIVNIMHRFSLAYPDVRFNLFNNDKEIFRTSGNGNLKQVIANIYGRKLTNKLLYVESSNEDFKISGYVSLPEVTRASYKYIYTFVNGRYVKNTLFNRAIFEGYGTKLMVGRYPIVVINITSDPHLLDVNLQPDKQQIRISQKNVLDNLIEKSIKTKFENIDLIPDTHSYMDEDDCNNHIINSINYNFDSVNDEQIINIKNEKDLSNEQIGSFFSKYKSVDLKNYQINDKLINDYHSKNGFPNLSYIGQLNGTFLFAQGVDGLYIIDQHAAQERIKYEFYRKEIGNVNDESQELLIPIILSYPTDEFLIINENISVLEKIGIFLEPFGKNSFILKRHPSWFINGQEEDTLKEIIDWLLNDKKLTVELFRERTAIMMSCKRSIKANHYLNDLQAKQLLNDLANTENPYNCPHGRPVLVHLSNLDLEKMFKRIQDNHNSWNEFDEHEF